MVRTHRRNRPRRPNLMLVIRMSLAAHRPSPRPFGAQLGISGSGPSQWRGNEIRPPVIRAADRIAWFIMPQWQSIARLPRIADAAMVLGELLYNVLPTGPVELKNRRPSPSFKTQRGSPPFQPSSIFAPRPRRGWRCPREKPRRDARSLADLLAIAFGEAVPGPR